MAAWTGASAWNPATGTNANVAAATRRLWTRKAMMGEVWLAHPIYARLALANQINTQDGLAVTSPAQFGTLKSEVQGYRPGDPLQSTQKTLLTNPRFKMKHAQVPVVYGLEEYLKNSGPASEVDIAAFLVKEAHRAIRHKLANWLYATSTTDEFDATEASTYFQSLHQGLKNPTNDSTTVTYGGITRTSTTAAGITNQEWCSACLSESFTYGVQDASIIASVANFRLMVAATKRRGSRVRNADLLFVSSEPNILALKAQVDAKSFQTNPGPLVKYGFDTFTIDNVECVADPSLGVSSASSTAELGSGSAAAYKWAFLLYIPSYELRLHTKRNFVLLPPMHQAQIAGGADEWAGRVMVSGNFVCWWPQYSVLRTNMTP